MKRDLYFSQDIYPSILEKLQGCRINDYSEDRRNFVTLREKKVLITGAAGSIGSEIAKKIALFNPRSIGLLDINESGLADLQLDLNDISNSVHKIYLTDISDERLLRNVFEDFVPDIIYHTAAYKHVPVMEIFPEQALRVNIIGTFNMVSIADEFDTEVFVLVSSDKAVNPTSIMGTSKKIAEGIVQNYRFDCDTKYITVRFGNVIGSRGSVSEIFRRQILKGGPVTLTHPEMKRYFMTIDQAVHLMLIASNVGEDGNLFILDMNEPVYVIDLIKEMIRSKQMTESSKIRISITGARPSEKLNEVLMTKEESKYAQFEDGFFRINTDYIEEDFSQYLKKFRDYENEFYFNISNLLFKHKSSSLASFN